MNKKKVFIVTDFYHSQQNTTGYMLEKLYKALKRSDEFVVNLITRYEENIPMLENTFFIKTPKLDKKNLFKRFIYDTVVTIKFSTKIIFKVTKHDTVFTTTTPIFLIVSIAVLKKIIRFKWILLVHDVFPENLVVTNVITRTSFIYKALYQLFSYVYQSADHLIVIGSDMQELMHKKTKSSNISVVQNWIDESDICIQSKKNNKILKELNWDGDQHVIFQFFGNLGRVQGLDILLESISRLKNLDKAKFLFIGDGAYVDKLKETIKKLNHRNIIYYGKVPPIDKSSGLNACDISFVTLAEGMKGLGVPSKAYYSMAADKHIFAIMDSDTEIVNMVKRHDIGWSCEPDDVDMIARKIDSIIESWDTTSHKVSPRNVLKEYYSENTAMKKILEIIKIT